MEHKCSKQETPHISRSPKFSIRDTLFISYSTNVQDMKFPVSHEAKMFNTRNSFISWNTNVQYNKFPPSHEAKMFNTRNSLYLMEHK